MEQVQVKGGTIKMHMTPSTSGTVIATIPQRTVLTVEGKKNEMWWLVGFKGKTGYVMSSFLSPYKEPDLTSVLVSLPADVVEEIMIACKKALGKRGYTK